MAGYVKRESYPEKGGNTAFCSYCNGYKHKPGCELYTGEQHDEEHHSHSKPDQCSLESNRDDRPSTETGGRTRNSEAFKEERRKQAESAITPAVKRPKRKVRISPVTIGSKAAGDAHEQPVNGEPEKES